ncbi:uncharacterized protein LOC135683374 [Rhopilema esculentum]|uniref:uncharacterized protein LOC135683374 n=1 Tax=Rhopilema esculentum TaxID=499914 RepID=UPI0031D2BDDD
MNYAFSYMDISSDDILTSNGNKVFSAENAKHGICAKSDQKNKVELLPKENSSLFSIKRMRTGKLRDGARRKEKSEIKELGNDNEERGSSMQFKAKDAWRIPRGHKNRGKYSPKDPTESGQKDPYGVRRYSKEHYFEMFRASDEGPVEDPRQTEDPVEELQVADQCRVVNDEEYEDVEQEMFPRTLYVAPCQGEPGFAKEYPRDTPNEKKIEGNDEQVTRMKSLDNRHSLASTESEDLLESQSSNIVLEFRSSSYCMTIQNGNKEGEGCGTLTVEDIE